MNQRRVFAVLLVILALILIAPIAYYLLIRSNSDALWRIVSQQCVPSQLASQTPGACVKVDLDQQFVLFKDEKGPHHYLVMPTFAVEGLESPGLDSVDAPPFMALAWSERARLSKEAGFPILDEYLSLAVNSRWGRTQHHLHVHLACLRTDVYETVARQAPDILPVWAPLPEKIDGSHYVAKRLPGKEFAQSNPIALLNDYLREQGESLGSFGLAMMQLSDGDFVLLATGLSLIDLDLGSAGKIQDFSCALARAGTTE